MPQKKDAVLRKSSDFIDKIPLFSWVGWEISCRQRNFPKLPNNNHMPQFNNWIIQFEGCFCSGQNFFFFYIYIYFIFLQMRHTTVWKVLSAVCVCLFFFSIFAILLFPKETRFSVQQDVSARSCMSTQVTSAAGTFSTVLITDGVNALSEAIHFTLATQNVLTSHWESWVDCISDHSKKSLLDITLTTPKDNKYMMQMKTVGKKKRGAGSQGFNFWRV